MLYGKLSILLLTDKVMKKFIVLLIIIAAVVFFYVRKDGKDGKENQSGVKSYDVTTVGDLAPKEKEAAPAAPAAESAASDTGAQPATAASSDSAPPQVIAAEGSALVHYFKKDKLDACSNETDTVERKLDAKYRYAPVAALVELTKPLPKEAQEANFVSALLPGTRFMNLRINKDGNATADFNAKLNEGLEGCKKEQRRMQIVNTLKGFPEIKNITITVDKVAW